MTQQFHQVLSSLLLTFSLSAQAGSGGISLGQTRVIFSAADKAQTLIVSNSGQQAYLVQARVQNGLDDTTPAPFIVTPPLFSLQGDSRQLLRLLPQDATLPSDQESLFYLSISAIPAQAEPVTAADRLSVGVRFVLKLFYRPQGLALPADNTPCLLTFKREAHGVRAINPTGYFQTLGMLAVDGHTVALDQQPAMVPPHSSIILAVDGPVNKVAWQTLTDFGGLSQSCQQTGSASTETTP
ncbi:fimbrial biogenesis chaperone [Serratia fonticola]|uniref:fimbrial biogenesis chaperone n=1 Tax=Serratia fonticola TaxID=47917 RepID=UPI00217B34CC|nr:molecular chaperone [Serratia fonticola]CAI1213840.1 Chaperone protein focC precursor [Serratia fonticola]